MASEKEGKGGIPDRLIAEVLRLSGERQSSRQIAAWLSEAHGVSVSHTTVGRTLKVHREERRETARAIVEEKLGSPDGLSADIDGIIALRKEAEVVRAIAFRELQSDPSARTIGAWATASREYRDTTKLALEIAGLSKPDDRDPDDDAAGRVVGRIASLLAGSGEDPGDPPEE